MRKPRYGVASSLDGFIAGPNGEYDWIVQDSAFDFAAFWAEFDECNKLPSGIVRLATRSRPPPEHRRTIEARGLRMAAASPSTEPM